MDQKDPAEQQSRRLADVAEDELLGLIFPLLPGGPHVQIGPGDDAAVFAVGSPRLIATTDTMVRGRDWLDAWSSARDVAAKALVQNRADVAAMGGRCTGILLTLVADPQTPLSWVLDLADEIGTRAGAAGVAVLGGDLSSAPTGVVAISISAFGELAPGVDPVRRDGARAGDVVAVAGSVGTSGAGLTLLQAGRGGEAPDLVDAHLRPDPDLSAGPAVAGVAGAMIDISDGLVRDAGRIARASGVLIRLDSAALAPDVTRLVPALTAAEARRCVLTGGEEHTLLATFPADSVPPGWRVIGQVLPRDLSDGAADAQGSAKSSSVVFVDDEPVRAGGWDHFAPDQ